MNRSKWNAAAFLLAVSTMTGLVLVLGVGLRRLREVPSSLVLRSERGAVLANPDSGFLQMKARNGDVIDFGARKESFPDWIPKYAGFEPRDVFLMKDKQGGGSIGFVVPETAQTLCKGYPQWLREAGMRVTQLSPQPKDGCMLLAEEPKQKVAALFSIGASAAGAAVNVTYTKK